MLFTVESGVLDAALKLVASLPDTDEHTVAAAAMDARGAIFIGVNVDHFTGGPCAEVVVLGVAAAAAAAPLITMVPVGNDGRGILPPCGRCRQVLSDYFPDIGVIMPAWPDEEGPTRVRVSSLLPGTYLRPERRPDLASSIFPHGTLTMSRKAARPAPSASTIRLTSDRPPWCLSLTMGQEP